MEPVYETTFKLRSPDCDFLGTWKPGAIFMAMQEFGEMHSVELGMGFSTLRPLGIAWVVTRILLDIHRVPTIGETISARTWPGKPRHAVYPRYYTFHDETGALIAAASSLWVLMDIESRSMVTAESRGLPPFESATIAPPIANPGGIVPVEGAARVWEQPITYTDLDVNLHVNNTKYVDWLCDRFPCAWHELNRMKRILVHFSSETKPDEPLTTSLTTDGLSFVYRGTRDGHVHFEMSGQFARRNGKD